MSLLEPKYSEEELVTETGQTIPLDKEFIEKQKQFFNEIIPNLFHEKAEKDPSFLQTFVQAATGSLFLPSKQSRPDYKITVEFCFSLDPANHMTIWTCTTTLLVPALTYSKAQFQERLDHALAESESFSMN